MLYKRNLKKIVHQYHEKGENCKNVIILNSQLSFTFDLPNALNYCQNDFVNLDHHEEKHSPYRHAFDNRRCAFTHLFSSAGEY
jgi:hypothetical protein